ncbi:MAG: hypothetical protein JJE44_12195 [Flavobacteriaceae bacterium]|nr:hypothetical protein [Flavobacteriaceae bacterium]
MAKKNKVINLFGDNNVIPNTKDVSYSKLLEQFIAPFQNNFPEDFFPEDIFEFAITAWNFGNISMLIPKEEFEKTMVLAAEGSDHYQLLRKMINYKAANFKTYSNFIKDFEFTEKKGKAILTVETQEKEAYFAEISGFSEMSGFDDDDDIDDFREYEENYINRFAIVVKPLKPFADWLFNLYPKDEYPEFMESHIYLVNDEIDDLEAWLKKKFDRFFKFELDNWHTEKKEWPQKRTYKMFKQWFQVELSTMVFDTEEEPVSKSLDLF